ncbi:aldehyde dehydrogenase (NADP(+)) [Corynebacterium glutamicum]|uniref:aldehyde dehydrogenase (NADP(+)) n=1 Tax=Corynebacterium glutamicum TaxID=1718 RepID=UPI0009457835|nr:aldehyde dehydrogenase (NADP(+)) [Corynebacterium glutamicum]OKX83679.1 aldehyde dehydrogenase (NADP(+)) [Corynebacterium glutamicum]
MATPYTASPLIQELEPSIEKMVAMADAAAEIFANTDPYSRARALNSIASALIDNAEELVRIAHEETGLSEARLHGELKRTAVQLRLFGDEIIDGSYLDVRIDRADPDFILGVRPELRMTRMPVGPVVVFAASNFPFAFSVAGGDTASALAAGCPVLLKAHSGHPKLSTRTGEIVTAALADAGMPRGIFAVFTGQENGTAVLKDPRVQAGSFTGSEYVGRLLADIAAARPQPIPFFGELGSLNPVFVTNKALETRAKDVVSGLVGAVSGSAGQLCTKPGFVFLPKNHDIDDLIRQEVEASNSQLGEQRLLNPGIARGYTSRFNQVVSAPGVDVVVEGSIRSKDDGQTWTTPTFVKVALENLRQNSKAILGEVFGPFTVLVEVPDGENPVHIANEFFTGSLTATIQAANEEESTELKELVRSLSRIAGRVLYGGWPTGVAVTHAMIHGGPWPATTNDTSTSVGTSAINRFLRAVTFQSVPESLLPAPVQESNPWNVPRVISEAGESEGWGQKASEVVKHLS